MGFFDSKERKRRRNLRRFRQAFLRMTGDGVYSRERQQKLYHWCDIADLDWDEARRFVRTESQALLHRHVGAITRHRPLSDEDITEIQRLQRRLGLDPTASTPAPSPASSWQRPALIILLLVLLVTGGSLLVWQWVGARNNQQQAGVVAPTHTTIPTATQLASPVPSAPPPTQPLLVPTAPSTTVAALPLPTATVVPPPATMTAAPPSPIPTATTGPTATPIPTETAEPTTTPIPTAVPTMTPIPTMTPTPVATGPERVIAVDTVQGKVVAFENLGDRFTVNNTPHLTESGMFIRLTIEAENVGKTALSFVIEQMMDGQERVFPPYNKMYVQEYCHGSLSLAPNLPSKCMMVYEVPRDAEEFTVTFRSGNSQQVLFLGAPQS